MEWQIKNMQLEEDANYAIGKISPWFVIGFALRMFWPFLAISGEYAFTNSAVGQNAPLLNLVSFIAFACTMLTYGIFFKHLRKLFSLSQRRDVIRLIAAFSIAVGVGTIILANVCPQLCFVLLIAAGIFTGFGSAILMMSYGVSASACDVASIALSAAASFALAIIAFALIVIFFHANAFICCILAIIIPFCEWVCLHQSSKHFIDKLEFSSITIPVRTVPFALHVAIPAFLFGMALAICRLFMMDILKDTTIDVASILIISAIISAVFIVIAVFTQRHIHNFMTRVLIPLITAVLAITVIFSLYNTTQYLFIFTCSYIFIAASIWVTLSNIAQRYRISAFTVYGFGYGTLLIGEVIVFFVSYINNNNINFIGNFSAIAILLVALVTIGASLLPREEELKRTLNLKSLANTRKPHVKQNSNSVKTSTELPNITQAHEEQTANMQHVEMTQDVQNSRANNVNKLENNTAQSVGVEEAHKKVPSDEETTQQEDSLPSSPASNEKLSEEHPLTTEIFDEVEQKIEENDQKEQLENGQDYFKRKCAVIADMYLLSRREAEVLLLLARGRNAAAIQNILYIAPGTANTHMRHIYRKINVHSQQELIELVENVELNAQ